MAVLENATGDCSHQPRILWNIKANELLLCALRLSRRSDYNARWMQRLEAENRELKSRSTLYGEFQRWFARKYDPNQPRIPAGNADGGQWTDDIAGGGGSAFEAGGRPYGAGPSAPDGTPVHLAQMRGGRRGAPSSGRMIGGRWVETRPEEELRIQLSAARADRAMRRVRELDPNWKPRPALYDSVAGEILYNERVVREAEDRMMELGRGAQPVLEWTPYGFRTVPDYRVFRQSIRDSLRNAGYKDVRVFLRGSAVTGRNYEQNSPFDGAKRSDYDFALVSPSMWRRLSDLNVSMRTGRTRSAPLNKTDSDALGLGEMRRFLNVLTGRKISFMIYRSEQDIASRPGDYARIELRIEP